MVIPRPQLYSGMSLIKYGVLCNLDHCVPVSFARDNLKRTVAKVQTLDY
ncbi:hypothetical protein PROFUN_16209 [Planoprotostelium fungivorum]|uniref:Uncharacterized protein n=1 Tax=Planoprotostelium fungivorum TaxID=1890364 RepID=A0A2P6MRN5_9EUKA|nr:hypothetical protein PROFUN_16209 [Planoprotostelium fungivorum]